MTARAITPLTSKANVVKGRAIILSDNPIDAQTLRIVVETVGVQVVGVCESADQALTIVEEMRPDLVLTSIFFGGEPAGIELSRCIQEQIGVPVIYLGAAEDPLLQLQIAMTQPAGLISDPSDTAYVQAVVTRALKGVRSPAAYAPY